MNKKKPDLDLLSKLSAAVSYQFANDHISPSVLISTLKNGKIYTSIVRYGDFKTVDYSGVKGKLVVCNATASSIGESLSYLSNKFLAIVKMSKREIDPLQALENHIKTDINNIKLTLHVKEHVFPSTDWIDEG